MTGMHPGYDIDATERITARLRQLVRGAEWNVGTASAEGRAGDVYIETEVARQLSLLASAVENGLIHTLDPECAPAGAGQILDAVESALDADLAGMELRAAVAHVNDTETTATTGADQ